MSTTPAWTILSSLPGPDRRVLAECSCGLRKRVLYHHIQSGRSRSCRRCSAQAIVERRWQGLPHVARGLRRRLRALHTNMLQRCENPAYASYHRYGGRGVVVARELRSFARFLDHVKSLVGYDDRTLVMDRKDNARGYEPGNIRFVTPRLNARNREHHVRVRFENRWWVATEFHERWCPRWHISTVHNRIHNGQSARTIIAAYRRAFP